MNIEKGAKILVMIKSNLIVMNVKIILVHKNR